MPAASSPPGSHLPKKKPKKKKYNPPNIGGTIKGAGSDATKAGGGKPSKKEREAAAKAHAAVVKANVAVAKAVSTTKPSKMKKGYYTRQLGGKKASGDSLTTEDKEQLRKVRELNKEYEDSSIVKKVLLAPPGVAAGDAPFIGKIGSPSNVTNAIKGIFKTGEKRAAVKGLESGTAKGLKSEAKRIKKTTMSVTKPKRLKIRRVRETVKKERAARREVLGETRKGQFWKRHRPTPVSGIPHRASALVRGGGVAAAPIAGTIIADQIVKQGKAASKDPKKYAETNLRMATSIPGAVVGDARDLGTTATRAVRKVAGEDDLSWDEVLAPTKGFLDEQGAYYKGLYQILTPGNDSVTRINPETGKEETVSPETAILDDYGITPLASVAGVTYAATRPGIAKIRGSSPEMKKGPVAARKAAALAAEASRIAKEQGPASDAARLANDIAAKAAEKARKAQRTGPRRRQVIRRQESEAHARTDSTAKAKAAAEIAPVERSIKNVARRFGNHVANSLAFLARTGYVKEGRSRADIVRDLETHLNNLDDPSKPLPLMADEPTTRDAIHSLLRDPEALDSPEVRDFLDTYKDFATNRAIERNPAGDGMPNPADERSRVLTQAQQMGKNAPPAIIPDDLSAHTDLNTEDFSFELGNAERALREEARSDAKTAVSLRRKARDRQRAAVQKAQSAVATAKRRLAEAKGAERLATSKAKDRLNRADKKILERIDPYVKARNALARAKDELRNAQKAYGNEARYSSLNDDPKLRAARERLDKAERRVVTAQGTFDSVMEDIQRTADIELAKKQRGEPHSPLADYGRGQFDTAERAAARTAQALRDTALAQRELDRVRKEGDAEANTLRDHATGYEHSAKTKTSYTNRARLSRRRDAEGLDLQEQGDLHGAAQKFAEAEELLKRAKSDQDKILHQWLKEVEAEREKRGWDEPAYVRQIDASKTGEPNALLDFPGGRIPPREHMKRGVLEREGRVAESAARLVDNIFRTRVALELSRYVDDFVRRRAKLNGDLVTGDEARAMHMAGQLADSDVLLPLQEFKRHVEANPGKALGEITDSLERNVREAEYEPGKKYVVVDKTALKEFREQLSPSSKGIRGMRHLTRAQSLLLLGTSPTWFEFQLAATPLVMAADNLNLRPYFKAFREHRRMSEMEKADQLAVFGGVSAESPGGIENHSIVGPSTSPTRIHGAIQRARRTPAGRLIERAAKFAGLPEGGPLIKGNKHYESYLRRIFALAKMDRVQNPSLYRKTAEKFGVSFKYAADAQAHLRGKSLAEIRKWYRENPDFEARLAESVSDAIGDWSAMTARERNLSAFIAFYPFMRFSLRWTFQTFPKNHPIKAVIALNLAQSNAQELERLLGGRPGFFGDWGTILSHTGEGPAAGQSALTTEGAGATPNNPGQVNITGAEGINLARIAPASNAIIEALGGSNRGLLQSALSPFSPAIGITASALAGQDPYTGDPLDADGAGDRIVAGLKGLAGLAGPLRTALDNEPSEMRRAFANLTGDERNQWERLLYPDLGADPLREGAALDLSKALETAAGDPETADIQALYEKWKRGEDIKPELTALRREVDDSAAASKYIDAIMQDQGFEFPRSAGEREARRKFGELYRRVFGEIKIDTPRVSSTRKKNLIAKDSSLSPEAKVEQLRKRSMSDDEISDAYPALRPYLGGGTGGDVMDKYRGGTSDIMDKYRSGTSSVMDQYR